MIYVEMTNTDWLHLLSDEDADLTQYKWCEDNYGYANRGKYINGVRKTISLYREVGMRIGIPEKSVIDHIDRDPRNNQRNNLRACTYSRNGANHKLIITNSSGYHGVSWNSQRQKWRAGIKFKSKAYHIGLYTNIEDAARAYDKFARRMFGEFATLNFPDES